MGESSGPEATLPRHFNKTMRVTPAPLISENEASGTAARIPFEWLGGGAVTLS